MQTVSVGCVFSGPNSSFLPSLVSSFLFSFCSFAILVLLDILSLQLFIWLLLWPPVCRRLVSINLARALVSCSCGGDVCNSFMIRGMWA